MIRTCVIFVLFILATASAADSLQPAEPLYGGRALSAWLKDLPVPRDFESTEQYATNAAVVAVRNIGTNALPDLLRWFQKPDGVKRMEVDLGLIFLGDSAKPTIPELTKLLNDSDLSDDVAIVLLRLGHDGILALTNGLASTNWSVRAGTALSFCVEAADAPQHSNDVAMIRFREERRVALPGILVLLHDPKYEVGAAAAYALRGFKQESDIVVPALNRIANDTNVDFHIRKVATNSLSRLTK